MLLLIHGLISPFQRWNWFCRCIQVHRVVRSEETNSLDMWERKRKTMKNLMFRLWKDEEGQDLTEYALLLVLLTLAAIGTLGTLAGAISGVFSSAAKNLGT
jgi:pilus assembly protein Flp/PilA